MPGVGTADRAPRLSLACKTRHSLVADPDVVGRPSARMLGAPARTRVPLLEVLRVAVVEDTHNGCSTLYGACARAARGMGVDGILTYIHSDEPGTTLRAAGWVTDGPRGGGEWARDGRQRKIALDGKPKIRWWAAFSLAVQPDKRFGR